MRKIDLVSIHDLFFKDFGFKFIESLMLFEKDFPHGKQVIFVHYTDYSDQSFLEYNLGVRIDKVEMIIHKFLPTLKDYAERSITMIQTLNKIGKKLPKRFTIENDWELSEAIMKTESFFVTDGFKWLDEMINPLNLERAFVEQRNNSFKTQNFVYNAFRATALCKIYNPKDYPEVRKSFLMQIREKDMTPFTLASFLQFLDYLDNLD
ncbi:hypothetical protein [Algoriphagus marinus]|uniref:hypothetical protein n=1 Tax=Algoriphagus marinus TaxID=1925762 RepID=UPI00094BB715|nr:hypothetical protein [Algoriphagus marinus]